MVETPAGCLFEDIQYEDIQVEAVNFQQQLEREDINVSSAGENGPSLSTANLSSLPTGKAGAGQG